MRSKLRCPIRGLGRRLLLMTDAQSLVAAKVNFEFWLFSWNQPSFTSHGLQFCAEAVKVLSWEVYSPLSLRGPYCND